MTIDCTYICRRLETKFYNLNIYPLTQTHLFKKENNIRQTDRIKLVVLWNYEPRKKLLRFDKYSTISLFQSKSWFHVNHKILEIMITSRILLTSPRLEKIIRLNQIAR